MPTESQSAGRDGPTVVAALEALARLGPYFTVCTRTPPPGGPAARPLRELYDPGANGALLGLVERLGRHLATERRVAASILFQEMAARLWSVLLGVAAATGRLPDLPPGLLCWRPRPSGGISLVLPGPTGWRSSPGLVAQPDLPTLPGLVWAGTVTDHLRPLHDAVRAATPISTRLLWGNAASALVGATQVLESDPGLAGPGRGLAAMLLEREPLRGAGTVTRRSVDGRTATTYVRRSCCLYYRVPGAGTCGDCVLRAQPRRIGRCGTPSQS